MIHMAVKSRLKDIIILTKEESQNNPDKWYPLDFLIQLRRMLDNNTDTIILLRHIDMINYYMLDQFHSYDDKVFSVINGFCINLEFLIAIDEALSILASLKISDNQYRMVDLLKEWRMLFQDDSSIPEAVRGEYSEKFALLYMKSHQFWKTVFPPHIDRILASSIPVNLKIQFRDCIEGL